MADKKKFNQGDYMSDMDMEDMVMPEMDMPMMQCPMMQCPLMQCPMMNYMGGPMYMQTPRHKGGHHEWDLEDIYEEDDESDYSSDDRDTHDWCPHPYYKKK